MFRNAKGENIVLVKFTDQNVINVKTHRDQKLSVWSFLHGVEELVDGHVDDALLAPGAVHGVGLAW